MFSFLDENKQDEISRIYPQLIEKFWRFHSNQAEVPPVSIISAAKIFSLRRLDVKGHHVTAQVTDHW